MRLFLFSSANIILIKFISLSKYAVVLENRLRALEILLVLRVLLLLMELMLLLKLQLILLLLFKVRLGYATWKIRRVISCTYSVSNKLLILHSLMLLFILANFINRSQFLKTIRAFFFKTSSFLYQWCLTLHHLLLLLLLLNHSHLMLQLLLLNKLLVLWVRVMLLVEVLLLLLLKLLLVWLIHMLLQLLMVSTCTSTSNELHVALRLSLLLELLLLISSLISLLLILLRDWKYWRVIEIRSKKRVLLLVLGTFLILDWLLLWLIKRIKDLLNWVLWSHIEILLHRQFNKLTCRRHIRSNTLSFLMLRIELVYDLLGVLLNLEVIRHELEWARQIESKVTLTFCWEWLLLEWNSWISLL